MPSTYAHARLGGLVLERLPQDLRDRLAPHRGLYDIGLHGPDILFFYRPLRPGPVSGLGYAMHERSGREVFTRAGRILADRPEEDRAAGFAYLCGFLCHFALDSLCHGVVGEATADGRVSHATVEMELDRALMLEDGLDPLRHSLTGHIHPTPEHARIIAPFFPGVTRDQVEKALRGMLFYHRILLAPGRPKRAVIDTGLRLAGKYQSIHGMMTSYQPDPACVVTTTRLRARFDRAADWAAERLPGWEACLLRDAPLGPEFDLNFESERVEGGAAQ